MRVVVLMIALLVPICLFAQKDPLNLSTLTMRIYESEQSIKCEMLRENKDVKVQDNLVYYWYKSNKIMETRGGFEGKLLHGAYSEFYIDNQLKKQAEFKNGLKHGEWRSWYSDGQLKESRNFQNGIDHGHYKAWDQQGKLSLEAEYKSGKLNGEMVSYKNGKELSRKEYKNGVEVIPVIKIEPSPKGVKAKKQKTPKEMAKPKPKQKAIPSDNPNSSKS